MSAEPTETTAATLPRKERLASLDLFRGLTVAGMLLVNNPGSWGHIYPPLEHAEWNGWTPTDLIFPFFLFIVGITTHLSMQRNEGASSLRILRRALLIVFFGLALNAFPFYMWGTAAFKTPPTVWERVVYRFDHLRFSGVLQRIGIVYLATAFLARRASQRRIVLIIVALLGVYFVIMTLLPVPGSGGILGAQLLDRPSQTTAAWLDRIALAPNHIWSGGKTWDPEGPLSTIPAIATALIGFLFGQLLTSSRTIHERLVLMYASGFFLLIGGLALDPLFPINKNLWSSSYVLFTAGAAALTLATVIWIVDVQQRGSVLRFFRPFGLNPLVAFVGSGAMARITDSLIKVGDGPSRTTLHVWIYRTFLEPRFDPRVASLIYAVLFIAFWWGVLRLMEKERWILRV